MQYAQTQSQMQSDLLIEFNFDTLYAIDMENERLAAWRAWRITYYMQFDPFDAYYSRVIERRTDSGREREKSLIFHALLQCIQELCKQNCNRIAFLYVFLGIFVVAHSAFVGR